MSHQRKKFIVETYFHGKHEFRATEERFVRRAAQAKGWWVKRIYKAPPKEEKEAA